MRVRSHSRTVSGSSAAAVAPRVPAPPPAAPLPAPRARPSAVAYAMAGLETLMKKRPAGDVEYTALQVVARSSRALCAATLLVLLLLAPYVGSGGAGVGGVAAPRAPGVRVRAGRPPRPAVSASPGVPTADVVDDAPAEARAAPFPPRSDEPLGLAAPAAALPAICVVRPAYHAWRDRDCYLEMERRFLDESAVAPEAPFCWGRASPTLLRPDVNASSLFHTVALTGLPGATKLLVDSFLATQCCDSVLWVWLDTQAMATARAAGTLPPVPAQHAGRVVYRALDVAAEFATVRGDFPDVNDTAAAGMQNFADVRFRANWARLLVLYRFGGVYVDLDTMFLRDFRPLLAASESFTYRQGSEIIMNIAVLRMRQRPDASTRDVIAEAARRQRVSQSALSIIMHPWDATSPWAGKIDYLASGLFDVVWYRFLAWSLRTHVNASLEAERVQTPELAARISAQGRGFTAEANWDAFFARLPADEAAAVERDNAPFFPGSLSYHWHNRYEQGIPEQSWAGLLHRRYRRMLENKVCVAPPA